MSMKSFEFIYHQIKGFQDLRILIREAFVVRECEGSSSGFRL